MIKVNNVTMAYGNRTVLNNISFEVKDNCITGFLGSNGAGKSTTMNILAGYLSPKSGEVFICDKSIQENPIEAKRNIGYLPEIPPLYNNMRVEEYLRFTAELRGIDNIYDEISRVLSLLNLEDRRFDIIKKLSKGLSQRVGLAGVLVGDPKVLILDEPMTGLDPAESKRTRELLKGLKEDHCIFISSHILSEIEELCAEIIMIKDGEVVIDNSVDSVNDKNENIYYLKVKGNKDKIWDDLKKYNNLKKIRFVKETEDGVCEFVVVSKNSRDIRDSIFSYLVGKKYNIYEISKREASLEDLYMRINNKEDQ